MQVSFVENVAFLVPPYNLRSERNLDARRIQTELIRLHNCPLSLASIHKALTGAFDFLAPQRPAFSSKCLQ